MTIGSPYVSPQPCSRCGRFDYDLTQVVTDGLNVPFCINCSESSAAESLRANLPPPKEIFRLLNQYVIGQYSAKRILAVGIYNHYKRAWLDRTDSEVELEKTNILLVGPTGCGKTHLAQTLARILNVPFSISDATSLTEAGYVGEDVENILLRLVQRADFKMSRAERGIIYIDEIDKIARKQANPSITRDVSGEGVQQALLKLMEGSVANIPPQGGRKHPQQECIQLDTSNVLFILGGAFEGIEEIMKVRQSGAGGIGFSSQYDHSDQVDFSDVCSDDMLRYGFIPEFIGRLPLVVGLADLTESELRQVLTEPKNSLVKQYQELMRMDGIILEFEPAALEEISATAASRGAGARSLRSLMEEVLMDVMYELPSLEGVRKCVVTKDAASKKDRPILLGERGGRLEWHASSDRGAA